MTQFWTDDVQAAERLLNCMVVYDGKPALIDTVEDGQAWFTSGAARFKKALDDPLWDDYRNVPLCGWYNGDNVEYDGAVYLQRTAQRTRSHGLTRANCELFDFGSGQISGSVHWSIARLVESAVFGECIKEGYPALADVFDHLRPGQAVALSLRYAVHNTGNGIYFVYRRRKLVAIMSNKDSISLIGKYAYLREEILESGLFPNNLQEI